MKIVLIDIENAPNIGYSWGKYEQNILEYIQDWYILCITWKWLGKKTQTVALPNFPIYKKDKTNDKELLKTIWPILDEADIVVAHNGQAFDLKKINARFIHHGMQPPSPYKVVDTLKAARKYFQFDSNKLDDLGKYLHIGQKLDTGGFPLFKACMDGNMTAWKKMIRYNRQDVNLLEKLYYKLRPWIENHPNYEEVTDKPKKCPACGSKQIHSKGFTLLVNNRQYRKFKCHTCGKHFHGRPHKIIEEKID